MNPVQVVDRALALLADGATLRTIGRELGVPPRTVCDWRSGKVPRRNRSRFLRSVEIDWESVRTPSYAYLLGLYLGDGHIARLARTYALRIFLDDRYPGIKHERRIALTASQAEITASYPHELIRGLIHSDGCRFVANQRVGGKTYSYARYSFSNRSDDIKAIFCDHLDLLGIRWTRPNRWSVAIDRRSEVARLDSFVGPKR